MNTWLRAQDCRLDEFRTLVEQFTHPGDYPHADGVEQNVLVYDSERLRAARDRGLVQTELVRALLDGPGLPPRISPYYPLSAAKQPSAAPMIVDDFFICRVAFPERT